MGTVLADLAFWMLLPLSIAIGSSLLVWLLMSSRVEVLRTRYDSLIANLRHTIEMQEAAYAAGLTQEAERARLAALEDLLREIRVERRQYLRRRRRLFREDVEVAIQERLSVHRIPLTAWSEPGVPLPAALFGASSESPAALTSGDTAASPAPGHLDLWQARG